ncbi:MAG TPA: aspartate kinase [Patescibacteria group bacterium]|nr:aspartate kinase [Patescibacteria group bacterium]
MRIIVQKFGGTSVATPQVRELVLRKIEKARDQGFSPVVVVSAMGRRGDPYATDTLLDLTRAACGSPAARELDQVMCCGEMISAVVMTATLQSAGMDAVMLTGGQAGIITDGNFGNGRILKVDPSHIKGFLKLGKIPVVCGFQGVSVDGELTTLGRGGSDTTGAVLGAALNAEMVEIYTDVDGIMTADPKIVDNAKILDYISYGEVCQLAHQGAKVIHPRAVEIAMQKNIPLTIKSTFSDAPGTLITHVAAENLSGAEITDRIATGVTYLSPIAQIKIKLEDNAMDAGSRVFRTMADAAINVDLINVHPGGIMYTVAEEAAEQAMTKLERLGYSATVLKGCAKVSVVGGGISEVPGVMASFVEALSEHRIAVLQTVDSHTSISVLIHQQDVVTAVTSLHEKFNLSDNFTQEEFL